MDNRAQISVELLIIMAALIAIALLFINSLHSSSKAASGKIDSSTKTAMKNIGKIK